MHESIDRRFNITFLGRFSHISLIGNLMPNSISCSFDWKLRLITSKKKRMKIVVTTKLDPDYINQPAMQTPLGYIPDNTTKPKFDSSRVHQIHSIRLEVKCSNKDQPKSLCKLLLEFQKCSTTHYIWTTSHHPHKFYPNKGSHDP